MWAFRERTFAPSLASQTNTAPSPLDVTTRDADAVLQWLDAALGVDEAYLSGASLHAVVPVDSPLTPLTLREQLLAAGHGDVEVTEVSPTIEDVFVNLVTRQR